MASGFLKIKLNLNRKGTKGDGTAAGNDNIPLATRWRQVWRHRVLCEK